MPNFITKLFKGAVAKGVSTPFTNISTYFNNKLGGFFSRQSFLSEYKNWVYTCINARAEDVANIELKLFKGDKEIFEHPALHVIEKVNAQMTKNDLFNATQAYKDLEGNAYWYVAKDGKDGKGDPKEIYILRPDKVQIVLDKENPLIVQGYVYSIDGTHKIPFSPEEIIHHKYFNPNGNFPFPHKGMGVVEATQWAIDTDNETRMFNIKFFQNSARPDGLLLSAEDGDFSPEQHKRLREEWNEEHQGSANAHKIAVISGGLKWQEISRSQSDMQFLEQRGFNRDEIMAMFRVPKTILGMTQDVNRASADASIYVFSLKVIKPLMQKIVDTLNEFYLPMFNEEGLYFKFTSPVQEDKEQIRNDFTAGVNKWLTRNEVREALGLPPTQNGDIIYDSSMLMEVDRLKKNKKKELPVAKEKKVLKTGVAKIVEDFIATLPVTKEYTFIEGDLRKNYIATWKINIDNNTKPLKRKLESYFDTQEKEVQSNLKTELKGLNKDEFVVKGIKGILFDFDNGVSAGISLITPFISQYIKESGGNAGDLVGLESFDDKTKRIELFKEERAKYFSNSINETTYDKLSKSVQEGIDNAESIDEISQRVADVYQMAKDSRTDMIARTEVSASANYGAKEAFLQADVEEWEWQVVNPKDAECIDNAGVVVKIGSMFPSGFEEPPVHPNCECTTLPVFNNN